MELLLFFLLSKTIAHKANNQTEYFCMHVGRLTQESGDFIDCILAELALLTENGGCWL